jgi:hypothetical protein
MAEPQYRPRASVYRSTGLLPPADYFESVRGAKIGYQSFCEKQVLALLAGKKAVAEADLKSHFERRALSPACGPMTSARTGGERGTSLWCSVAWS